MRHTGKRKKSHPEEDIIKKILTCAEMDRLTLELKNKEKTEYYKTWNKLMVGKEEKGLEEKRFRVCRTDSAQYLDKYANKDKGYVFKIKVPRYDKR